MEAGRGTGLSSQVGTTTVSTVGGKLCLLSALDSKPIDGRSPRLGGSWYGKSTLEVMISMIGMIAVLVARNVVLEASDDE